ncbi:M50 family metallopeptidase [Patulibacter defluvii]|uniref:M50 family metallopeptidase n=1 Tax=Patulibacter defluvii TaxID=3095358 RepID=UPI002A75296F|nr:site-2 protease family protein [Patulibacter sp. DM4]
MSWVLAFLGFSVLIVLHELGHFAAAKAVGMRVEKFSLFFGKPLLSRRRGETEYAIGFIPLGGYVKITGMDPREELPADVAARAYHRQPVWKRVVVIFAGPAVNIVLAIVIIVLLWGGKSAVPTIAPVVGSVDQKGAVARVLKPDDRIVSIDRVPGYAPGLTFDNTVDRLDRLRRTVSDHRCADGSTKDGCVAATPVRIVYERDGVQRSAEVFPRYVARPSPGDREGRMLLGMTYGFDYLHTGRTEAAGKGVQYLWEATKLTGKAIVKLVYDSEARKEVSGVVGSYEATRQSFELSTTRAIQILAIISLSLAIINLFPFLPLDGGHIFWALAEKVRGRPIPFAWLERASVVGFALVIMLFGLGLYNDVGRIFGEGIDVR